jgi:DNA mismatch endonuclease (patch repair protein)
MSRIRGKDTTPERVVRSLLHRLGYRFRLHVRIPITTKYTEHTKPVGHKRTQRTQRISFPQQSTLNPLARRSAAKTAQLKQRFVTPDIILVKQRVAIFINGCFWHRHRGCKNCTTPTHRRDWWLKKLEGNATRDKLHQRALRKLGWRPMVIWECETEKLEKLARLQTRLERTLSATKERLSSHRRKRREQRLGTGGT